MKKSHLKSVIKAIIKEAAMANTFRVVLKGDKSAREMFGRSFVKTGKGKMPVQVSMPDDETTIYVVWDGEVLQTIQTILQGLGWKKESVKDKDIIWSAPQRAMGK